MQMRKVSVIVITATYLDMTFATTANITGEPMDDLISRQTAIDAVNTWFELYVVNRTTANAVSIQDMLRALPSAQPEEVVPHKNYKYLSDYWCECGWHLGKKGDVKYCSDCGRKVKWNG